MAPLLALENISKRFGAVVVADNVSLPLAEGEALGIIGPNGAGKTTLFGIATGTMASGRRPPALARVLQRRDQVAGDHSCEGKQFVEEPLSYRPQNIHQDYEQDQPIKGRKSQHAASPYSGNGRPVSCV